MDRCSLPASRTPRSKRSPAQRNPAPASQEGRGSAATGSAGPRGSRREAGFRPSGVPGRSAPGWKKYDGGWRRCARAPSNSAQGRTDSKLPSASLPLLSRLRPSGSRSNTPKPRKSSPPQGALQSVASGIYLGIHVPAVYLARIMCQERSQAL